MYPKYVVLIKKDARLPSRQVLLDEAWGENMPISYIQDEEALDAASYLDIKVNKWEINPAWSTLQDEEPWIRIEIFRKKGVDEFRGGIARNFSSNLEGYILLSFELDDGWDEIDLLLLGRLVKVISINNECYALNDSGEYMHCEDLFYSIPSVSVIQKLLLFGEKNYQN